MITCSTLVGSSFACSSAPLMRMAPSWVAGMEERLPQEAAQRGAGGGYDYNFFAHKFS